MTRLPSCGSSRSSRRLIDSARSTERRSFSGSGPVRLLCPLTSRQSIGPQRPYGDLLYPKTIGFADFRVGPKRRRSWSKQELYRETPRTQAIIDDIAERLRGRRTTAEPPVGEINAVVHAQLIASRQAPSVQIEVKCFLVAARVIGCDGIANQRCREYVIEILRRYRLADFALVTGVDVRPSGGIPRPMLGYRGTAE